ncbi:trigger factor [Buchnera aphidicola (Aphis helianthi)]|uniref:Trigger factor n=1 Tax=Buchnera aphidicola (Aphis helianthi) TaxID=2315802 RepID=A0A4D6XK38_9GAMM|nr:trigger factor [Buchnera aphidicola]QCI17276.1 trigger factor [Buchnera aphidicola (Aphis helianthi)]
MKFLLEKNKDAGHRVTINIPKIIIDNALIKEFAKINQKTNINGFRKGKIPIKIIQNRYGNSVYYDVFNKLMQKFFLEFLNKEKINIIGYPKYHIDKKEEQNDNFKYSVTYEVYPKVKVKDLSLIKAEKIIVNVTDEDIKKNIIDSQEEKNTWYQVSRSIKINDRVTINYCAYENNKKIEQFDKKNVQFIVFKNHLLNELNNKIINHYTNDIIFLKIFFSSFHPEKELTNKHITLKIKIIKIEEKQDIQIDTKIKNTKFIELNLKSIKNKTIKDINQLTQNYLKNQIIQKLIKVNPIKIPPILLQEEIKNLHKKLIEEYKSETKNILDKKYHVNLSLHAKKRLYTKFILEKIINDNKISIDDKKIKLKIKEMAEKYKKSLEIINLYKKNEMLKKTIKNLELEKKVIKFIKNKIKITEKPYTFNEFINYHLNYQEELFF